MAEQYFTADPTCESKQVPCSFVYRGHGLNFMTDAGVFSKGELDTGTRLLLDALPDVYGDVLDLGCGWGAIGVAVKKKYPAAHVTMVDVNRRALELCRFNAVRNGITADQICSFLEEYSENDVLMKEADAKLERSNPGLHMNGKVEDLNIRSESGVYYKIPMNITDQIYLWEVVLEEGREV